MISKPNSSRKFLFCLLAPALLWACQEDERQDPSLERARAMLQSGDVVGAEIMLQDLQSTGTAREDIAAYMGEAKLRQGDLTDAQRWLADGKFSKDSAGYGFRMLGWLELQRNNLPAAGRAYDRSYEFTPDDPELWVDIGRLRYRGGEQLQAVEASEKALQLGPENPAALEFRAQLIRDAEGPQAALAWFERALERNPDSLGLMGEYAATLGELGRAKDMLKVVRRMTEIDGRHPKALYLQAVLAARAGKDQLAQRLMQLTDDNHRNMPAGRLLSGVIDMRSGNYASAAQTFDQLAQIQPDNRIVRQLLARALLLSDSHREMVHRFGGVALQPAGSPYLAMSVGRSLEALGKRDEAARYLDRVSISRANQMLPLSGTVPLNVAEKRGVAEGRNALSLVRGLISASNAQAAASRAEAFRRRYPGSADALSLAGDAWLAAGNRSRALALYEQSSRVRRTWPLARRMYTVYRGLGNDNAAEHLMSAELQGQPSNAEAAALLGELAFEYQKYPIAAELLDRAIANGAARDGNVLDLRAQTALRMGDHQRAVETARQAYELNRSSRRATLTYASILNALEPNSPAAASLAAKGAAMEN